MGTQDRIENDGGARNTVNLGFTDNLSFEKSLSEIFRTLIISLIYKF
jgi:hypothetical protein